MQVLLLPYKLFIIEEAYIFPLDYRKWLFVIIFVEISGTLPNAYNIYIPDYDLYQP